MNNRLLEIGPQQRRKIRTGIHSICSSCSMVLETAIEQAGRNRSNLIIESTCNQVNQYGGYAAMTPADFAAYVKSLAAKTGFPDERLMIGGDHLGPYPWRHEAAKNAMDKAERLVRDCVTAGYGKIHIDCGMPLGGDAVDATFISPELSAERTVRLCQAAEAARSDMQRKQGLPLYVIGAEAPIPGGSLQDSQTIPVTDPQEISHFLTICRDLFCREGQEDAWQRVVAIVVQPGIDFGPDSFIPYDPGRARSLSGFHGRLPGNMTYEVHSTDFQNEKSLTNMVGDHFALLKTGPVLTFAFREAVFALAHMEKELVKGNKNAQPSDIITIIDREMALSTKNWRSHVREDSKDARVYRLYGFTDRVRYYWNTPAVKTAYARLMKNLDRPIPGGLISQYLPEAHRDINDGNLAAKPVYLIRHRILKALAPYINACRSGR